MKLRTLRMTLTFVSLFFSAFVIVSHICVLSHYQCLSVGTTFRSSMYASLSMQESLQDIHRLTRGLNHHTWRKNCVRKIETLCNFPIFPKAPDQRRIIHKTEIKEPMDAATDGHRLIGFLLPDKTGEYHFAVAANGFAEVWLSRSENWRASKLIASARLMREKSWDFTGSETQISSGVALEATVSYYIEILYVLGASNRTDNFLQVAWKRPQGSNFEVITGKYLSLFTNDSSMAKNRVFDDGLPFAHSCTSKRKYGHNNKHMTKDSDMISFLEHSEVNKALKYCKYRPSYSIEASHLKDFKRFDGVRRYIQRTYIYPFPVVDGIIQLKRSLNLYYEFALDKEEAWSIVYKYMDALEVSYFG